MSIMETNTENLEWTYYVKHYVIHDVTLSYLVFVIMMIFKHFPEIVENGTG
jgi:hypothetical protein